jgi:hypothetical protein
MKNGGNVQCFLRRFILRELPVSVLCRNPTDLKMLALFAHSYAIVRMMTEKTATDRSDALVLLCGSPDFLNYALGKLVAYPTIFQQSPSAAGYAKNACSTRSLTVAAQRGEVIGTDVFPAEAGTTNGRARSTPCASTSVTGVGKRNLRRPLSG